MNSPEATWPLNGRLAMGSQGGLAPRTVLRSLCSGPCQVAEKLETLKKQYDEKLAQKEELRKKSEEMEVKLERAGLLVSGLAGEKARWEDTVQVRPAPRPGAPSCQSAAPFRLRDPGV